MRVQQEQEVFNIAIAGLEQKKASLEKNIISSTQTVSREIVKMAASAREAAASFTLELNQGREAALREILHLRSETLEVGKEIGKLENILRLMSGWLASWH